MTFLAVEIAAADMYAKGCAVAGTMVTVEMVFLVPAEYNAVLDLMRYSAGNHISRAQIRAAVRRISLALNQCGEESGGRALFAAIGRGAGRERHGQGDGRGRGNRPDQATKVNHTEW